MENFTNIIVSIEDSKVIGIYSVHFYMIHSALEVSEKWKLYLLSTEDSKVVEIYNKVTHMLIP